MLKKVVTRLILLTAIGLWASTPLPAVPGATGDLAVTRHPSFLLVQLPPALTSTSLPLGLLTYVSQATDIISYGSGEIPEPTLDTGKLLIGLQFPYMVIPSLPTSPERVELRVSSTSIILASTGGDIDFGSLLDALAMKPARVALETPAFVQVWTTMVGAFRVDTGYSLDVLAIEVTGDSQLANLLSGAPIEPDTRYNVDVRSVADFSVGVRVTAGAPITSRYGVILPAVSVRVPVSVAHAEATAGLSIGTDSQSLPTSTGVAWQAIYWKPGDGMGIGVAMDAGIAIQAGWITVGIALESLVSAWHANGIRASSDDLETGPVVINDLRLRFAPLFAVVHTRRGQTGTLIALAGTAGYRAGPVGSLAATITRDSLSVVAGGGYDHGLRLGFGIGVAVGPVYTEPSLEVRTDPLTGQRLVRPALQVGRDRNSRSTIR